MVTNCAIYAGVCIMNTGNKPVERKGCHRQHSCRSTGTGHADMRYER